MKAWLVAGVLTLVACGGPPAEAPAQPTQAERAETTSAPTDSGAPVPEALDFTASLVDGGQIDGGDLAGKDVVLWFWAPW